MDIKVIVDRNHVILERSFPQFFTMPRMETPISAEFQQMLLHDLGLAFDERVQEYVDLVNRINEEDAIHELFDLASSN